MGRVKFYVAMLLALGIVLLEFRWMIVSMAIDVVLVAALIWLFRSEVKPKKGGDMTKD